MTHDPTALCAVQTQNKKTNFCLKEMYNLTNPPVKEKLNTLSF